MKEEMVRVSFSITFVIPYSPIVEGPCGPVWRSPSETLRLLRNSDYFVIPYFLPFPHFPISQYPHR